MTAPWGLPTYPISDGMVLRKRPMEQYVWLIERGIFTCWHRKYLIRKHHDAYQLLRNIAPEPELEAEAPTLAALIALNNLPIAQFCWHPNWEEDPV